MQGMSFTWLPERGRDNDRTSDILHVMADGTHYAVYIPDEIMEDNRLTLDECKAMAERQIARDPSIRKVHITNAGR